MPGALIGIRDTVIHKTDPLSSLLKLSTEWGEGRQDRGEQQVPQDPWGKC